MDSEEEKVLYLSRVGRDKIFKYGTYNSLSAEDTKGNSLSGYYYYNNSLRSSPGDQKTYPPYLKCADAAEALRKIYTFRK